MRPVLELVYRSFSSLLVIKVVDDGQEPEGINRYVSGLNRKIVEYVINKLIV